MNKLEIALIEWARAKEAVRSIDKQIGDALSESAMAAPDADTWKPLNKNKWLTLAYERAYEGPYDGYYYVNHEEDVEGFLAENCKHALRAHELIQQRKPLRAALGVAKRRLSLLATNLAKKAVHA